MLRNTFYMLSGMVDTLMLSSVSDQAVGAVGTANTYISVFIIMFGVISSGMVAVMTQNIGAGKPGIAYRARQLGLIFNAVIGVLMSVFLAVFPVIFLKWSALHRRSLIRQILICALLEVPAFKCSHTDLFKLPESFRLHKTVTLGINYWKCH